MHTISLLTGRLCVNMKLLLLAAVCLASSFAVNVEEHLERFGYLNRNQFDGASSKEAALKKFQANFNLPVTGVADEETVKLMSTPRCGRPDNDGSNAFADTAWRKKTLTYYFNNYTPDLGESKTRALTIESLRFWASVTPLHFSERENGDIVIGFGSRSHHDGKRQCGFSFDGRGGVLAHAFFPPDGRLHFDEDEYYTAKSTSGTNYLWVATHELGHILGLEHDTRTRDAVMYPYYRSYTPNMQLHSNDIRRIRALYGYGRGSVNGKSGGGGGSTGGGGGGGTGGNGSCTDRVIDCARNIKGCSQWGQAWIDYMKRSCRKTCRFC